MGVASVVVAMVLACADVTTVTVFVSTVFITLLLEDFDDGVLFGDEERCGVPGFDMSLMDDAFVLEDVTECFTLAVEVFVDDVAEVVVGTVVVTPFAGGVKDFLGDFVGVIFVDVIDEDFVDVDVLDVVNVLEVGVAFADAVELCFIDAVVHLTDDNVATF